MQLSAATVDTVLIWERDWLRFDVKILFSGKQESLHLAFIVRPHATGEFHSSMCVYIITRYSCHILMYVLYK